MEVPLAVPVFLVMFAVASCDHTPRPRASAIAPVTRLFGPVVSQQVIAGREEDADVIMLLVDRSIVHIDLRERRVSTTAIRTEAGETCWGLARLTDGSVWTLKGRTAVIRVESDGGVSRVMHLSEPHAGLFAAGDRLVYQRAVAAASEPALRAAAPGGQPTEWSALRIRSVPGIARAQGSALSLVACGRSRVPERACWFPDEAAVALIAPDGTTRRIVLAGLAEVAPEVLLTAENPRRPVRDAYIDEQRRLWVLSSGEAPPDSPDVPGGWILARYRLDGTPDGQVRLAEPARLILRADNRAVILLTGSGHVGEVASW